MKIDRHDALFDESHPLTTQYAGASENGQSTEDEASEPHVTILLRDY